MKTADVRADIPLLKEVVYLDAASTTPTPRPVIEAICDYLYNYNANTGRGAYNLAVRATNELEHARDKIAKFLNSRSDEIIFTKNTTEAINLVAHGLSFRKGGNIIVSNIEHHSNFIPWLNLKKQGVKIKVVKADERGIIDPDIVENNIDEDTQLVAISHISNSIGALQPVDEISKITEAHGIHYLVDAAQAAGHIKLDLKKLKADFVAFPGHKGLLGPVGTGFLYCNHKLTEEIEPLNLGGGTVDHVTDEEFTLTKSPHRFEGGTQNIAGFIGLGRAIDYLNSIGMDKIERHSRELTKFMYQGIQNIGRTTVYGSPENIYGMVGFNIDGINPNEAAKILDETAKICVRSGFHCAIPAIEHLGAYGFGGTIRASVHYYNTMEEIELLIDAVKNILVMGD